MATALLHGLAVAADPVPSYVDFADSAIIGDWDNGLGRLCLDAELRQQLVATGRKRLDESWTLPVISGQWLAFFQWLVKLVD